MSGALSRVAVALGASCLAALSAVVPPSAAARPERDQQVVTIADPAITEASGLVAFDGVFVTVNDSGGEPVLFSVDADTGETVETTRFAEDQTDVEGLAPAGGNDVWVGDIGDNDGVRRGLEVTLVTVDGSADAAGATSYRLFYAHHAKHDAEALLADPATGRLYVVTKSFAGGLVYQTPEHLNPSTPNKLTRIGQVGGPITDGAFLPDGHHIVLRDYARATVYSFPELELVGQFVLPLEPQGEALAVGADGSLFVTSEGNHQPILRVQLPRYLAAVLDEEPVADQVSSPGTTPGSAAATPPASDRFRPVFIVVGVGGILALLGLIAIARRRTPVRAEPGL